MIVMSRMLRWTCTMLMGILVLDMMQVALAEVPLFCGDSYLNCQDPKLKQLICHDKEFKNMAQFRCPKTCGQCQANRTKNPLDFLVGCRDKSEECLLKLDLCQKPQYFKIMSRMCPLTCNFCGMWNKARPRKLKRRQRLAVKKARAF